MRVSTAAFCTLTALAVGEVTPKAIAAPIPSTELPPAEDAEALLEELAAGEVISVAPTESIAIEPFANPNVPEIIPDVSASRLIPVADLMTANTVPETVFAPETVFVPESVIVPTVISEPGVAPEAVISEPVISEPVISEPVISESVISEPVTPEITSSATITPRMPIEAVLPVAPAPAPAPAELIAQAPLFTPEVMAQRPQAPEQDPTDQEIEELQRQLEGVPNLEPDFGDEFGGSPAITLSNPSGRGADRFTAFLNGSFQADKRYENGADGALGIGIGLGDAREAVGLQLSYTLASFGTLDRDFGTGGFNAKLHRQFDNGLSVALGWEGFATIGDVDFEDTIYGSVTQIIRTTPDIDTPLSRIALTAGVGNGRFRSEDDFNNDEDSFNVFGSAAVRIARPVSVIVEWTGQDLAAGLSITPIRNFPLVITPALRDIAGAGDGARFVLGTGVSFRF